MCFESLFIKFVAVLVKCSHLCADELACDLPHTLLKSSLCSVAYELRLRRVQLVNENRSSFFLGIHNYFEFHNCCFLITKCYTMFGFVTIQQSVDLFIWLLVRPFLELLHIMDIRIWLYASILNPS